MTMIILGIKAGVKNAQVSVEIGNQIHFDLTLLRQTICVLHQTTSNTIMPSLYSNPTLRADVLKAAQLICPDVKSRYIFDYRCSK